VAERKPGNIVRHRLSVVEQKLGPVREPDAKQVRICALTAAPAWVNYEILDLEKAIQPEIPVSDLLWINRSTPPGYAAANNR
jgi:hypothetical protein